MKRASSILTALALLLAIAAGCSKTGSGSSTDAGASGPPAASSGGLLAKSLYDDGPRAGESPVDAAQVTTGEALFKTKGCSACHGFGVRLSCPDLKGVTQRRTSAWMQQQILHPDVMTKTDPISHGLMAVYTLQMPNQGLTQEQALQVIEYLKHRDHEGK